MVNETVLKMNRNRIIVPLDFDNEAAALALADRLNPEQCRAKVGKELFTAAGPHVVRELHARGFEVFLDLKYHDIPNTVAAAVRAATKLGVWMINVHAIGGLAMMQAARAAVDEVSAQTPSRKKPLLIGVTILTSMSNADVASVGYQGTALDNVLRLAKLSLQAGLDGVVCSAAEVTSLRAASSGIGHAFTLVTPGIRTAADAAGDQQRVVTPGQAIADGSDYLVMGRPITGAPDPIAKLAAVQAEVDAALAAR
jgi:orotidine-5'-phosphate decarboxylase